MSRRRSLVLLVAIAAIAACSGKAVEKKPDVAFLPRELGLMIAESSSNFDSAAIEVVDVDTHAHRLIEGFAMDSDMHLRRRIDPRDRRVRYFTVNSRRGSITERLASGQSIAEHVVYDEGLPIASADPLDVAIGSDGSLWITRFFQSTLIVLEPDGRRRRTIDLAPFADADGKPDMSAIAIVGDTAYVALRNLTARGGQLHAENVSKLVAIDTKTYEPRAFLDLPAPNPWEEIGARENGQSTELWLSCIGGPLSTPPAESGALLRIDLATKTITKLLRGEETHAFVVAHHVVSDTEAYAILAAYGGENPTSAVRFDPSRNAIVHTFAKTADYKLWDVAPVPRTDFLLIADRTLQAPGLRVLSRRDGTVVGHVATRLLPIEFLVLQ